MTKIDNGAVAASAHGIARSPHWPTVEKAFKALHPNCIACSAELYGKVGIQVHHAVVPFHIAILCGRPDLELDPRNLVSLCETEKDKPAPNHHIRVGHLGDFKSWNSNVVADAKKYLGQPEALIESNPDYILEAKGKSDPKMAEQRDALKTMRTMLDSVLPADPAILKKYGIVLTPFV